METNTAAIAVRLEPDVRVCFVGDSFVAGGVMHSLGVGPDAWLRTATTKG